MNLATRDHKIFQMKAEIENRKKLLCAKRREIAKNIKENTFLKDVADDYNRYNAHIISQQKQQIEAFELLNRYITNITDELELADNKLKDSRLEQREIMRVIEHLKSELDNLVEKQEDV
jgi:hypothetical protein